MKIPKILGLAVVCLLSSGLPLRAASFALNSNAADATIANNSGSPAIVTTTDFASRIGEFFSPGVSISVLPFQLPTLAPGEQFTIANLRLQLFALDNGNGGLGNVDLYGLTRSDVSPTVLASDFYAGPNPDPTAILLQGSFITPTSTVRTDPNTGPFINTSASANIALVNFLNTQYGGGTGAGKFVFLRLSYNQNPSVAGNNSYQILTADAGGAAEKPLLTLTSAAVPEPSSIAFLISGAGVAGYLSFRKRRVS